MKAKYIILPACLCAWSLPAVSQIQYPAGYDGYTMDALKGEKIRVETYNGSGYNASVTYFDKMSRPEQTVGVGASPSGADVVSFTVYDIMGRGDSVEWMPYTVPSSGAKRLNPEAEARSFYQTMFPDDPDNAYPYSRTQYDTSPLGLPSAKSSPGYIHSLEQHPVRYSHRLNRAADSIKYFDIVRDSVLRFVGYCSAGSLTVSRTASDIEGTPVTTAQLSTYVGVYKTEYKDSEGRLIAEETSDSKGERRTTYYVYDAMGRQRYVLPPAAHAGIKTPASTYAPSDLRPSSFYTEYDQYGRVTVLWLPDRDAQYNVYDSRNRLVMSQDGNMRGSNRWQYCAYDNLDRPVELSIVECGRTAEELREFYASCDNSYPYLAGAVDSRKPFGNDITLDTHLASYRYAGAEYPDAKTDTAYSVSTKIFVRFSRDALQHNNYVGLTDNLGTPYFRPDGWIYDAFHIASYDDYDFYYVPEEYVEFIRSLEPPYRSIYQLQEHFPGAGRPVDRVSAEKARETVVITEIMYDSPLNEQIATGQPYSNGEYVELCNLGDEKVNLSGWTLTGDGVTEAYRIPSGTVLAPREVLLIAYQYKDTDFQLSDLYQVEGSPKILYQRKVILSNGGETVSLLDRDGRVKDRIYYHGTSITPKPGTLHAPNPDGMDGVFCQSLHRKNVSLAYEGTWSTLSNNYDWETYDVWPGRVRAHLPCEVPAAAHSIPLELMWKSVPGVVVNYYPAENRQKIYEKVAVLGGEPGEYVERAFYYDNKGRLTQTVVRNHLGGLSRISCAYNFAGNVTKLHEWRQPGPGAAAAVKTTTYAYDRFGRLLSESASLDGCEPILTRYYHNEVGRIESTARGQSSSTSAGRTDIGRTNEKEYVLTDRMTYNLPGSLVGIENPSFEYTVGYHKPLGTMTLGYSDLTDNITGVEWVHKRNGTPRQVYNFTYDNLGRLKGSLRVVNQRPIADEFVERDITYDTNDNITSLVRDGSIYKFSYNGSRLKSLTVTPPAPPSGGSVAITHYNYGYDANGNMTYAGPLSLIGHPLGRGFEYNCLDLLEKTTERESGRPLARYTYLADGTKVGVRDSLGRGYVYLGSLTYSADGDSLRLESTGFAGGRIMAVQTPTGVVYSPRYFVTDHLGSVRQVLDENGAVLESSDYYPLGSRWADGGRPVSTNRYRYAGKELQTTGGLGFIDYGSRMYDPVISHWLTQDPAMQFANPYVFCGNNPVCYIDPDGEFIISFLCGFVEGLITGHNPWKTGWHDVKMTWGLVEGLFTGNFSQILNRFTWEILQTTFGFVANLGANWFNTLGSVEHYGGATIARMSGIDFGAITLGSYILGDKDIKADPENTLFQHEYGHYIQSQKFGLAYLFHYGIPSIGSAAGSGDHSRYWTEMDANGRAYDYFTTHAPGFNAKKWNGKRNPMHYDKVPVQKLDPGFYGFDYTAQFPESSLNKSGAFGNGTESSAAYSMRKLQRVSDGKFKTMLY